MNDVFFLVIAVVFVVLSFVILYRQGRGAKLRKDMRSADGAESEINELIDDATPFHAGLPDDFTPTVMKVEGQPEVSLTEALKKTEESFWGRIRGVFASSSHSPQVLDEIEEVLYTSDLGPQTVERLMVALRKKMSKGELSDLEGLKQGLREEILEVFKAGNKAEDATKRETESELSELFLKSGGGPLVFLIVGVNGVGKTTTIGKLSALFARMNKKVLVAAGDTFRAAAEKQLKTWTDRAQVEIFSLEGTKDPSAVAFDAISKATAKNYDVVIIDTAGRLHNQSHLMEELKKMKRVMAKVIPESPHHSWIILDANNGQNALAQAREFHKAIHLDGVILTKMDGTAKGGIAISIVQELDIPIRFIGVGESLQDLRPFQAEAFVAAIL